MLRLISPVYRNLYNRGSYRLVLKAELSRLFHGSGVVCERRFLKPAEKQTKVGETISKSRSNHETEGENEDAATAARLQEVLNKIRAKEGRIVSVEPSRGQEAADTLGSPSERQVSLEDSTKAKIAQEANDDSSFRFVRNFFGCLVFVAFCYGIAAYEDSKITPEERAAMRAKRAADDARRAAELTKERKKHGFHHTTDMNNAAVKECDAIGARAILREKAGDTAGAMHLFEERYNKAIEHWGTEGENTKIALKDYSLVRANYYGEEAVSAAGRNQWTLAKYYLDQRLVIVEEYAPHQASIVREEISAVRDAARSYGEYL